MISDQDGIFNTYANRKKHIVLESKMSNYSFPLFRGALESDINTVEALFEEGFGDYLTDIKSKAKGFIKDKVISKLIKLIISKIDVSDTTHKESVELEKEIIGSYSSVKGYNNNKFLFNSFFSESDIQTILDGSILLEAKAVKEPSALALKRRQNKIDKLTKEIRSNIEVLSRDIGEHLYEYGKQDPNFRVDDYLKTFDGKIKDYIKNASQRGPNTISSTSVDKPIKSRTIKAPKANAPKATVASYDTIEDEPFEPQGERDTPTKEGMLKRILNWTKNHPKISMSTAAIVLSTIIATVGYSEEIISAIKGALLMYGIYKVTDKYNIEDFIQTVKDGARGMLRH